MKKTMTAALLASLLLLSACGQTPGEAPADTGDSIHAETAAETVTQTVTETVTQTPVKIPTGSPTQGAPSHTVDFASMDDVRWFISVVTLSDEEYRKSWSEHQTTLPMSRSQAAGYAEKLKAALYPSLPDPDVEINATLTTDRNELDMIFRLNDVRYRFTYDFNCPTYDVEVEIIAELSIGGYTFPIHKSGLDGDWLGGFTKVGNATVSLIIYSDDVESVKSIAESIRFMTAEGESVS